MNRTRQAFAPVAFATLLALSLGSPAQARHRRMSLDERIKFSNYILVGTVTKVEDGKGRAHGKVASLAIQTLLHGERRKLGDTPELIFATGYACDGQTFTIGDKAIFFLAKKKNGYCYRINWEGGAAGIEGDKVKDTGKLEHKGPKPLSLKAASKSLRKRIKAVHGKVKSKSSTGKSTPGTSQKSTSGTSTGSKPATTSAKTAAKPATPSCETCGKTDKIVKVFYGFASMAEAARHGGKSGGCCLDKSSPSHWCERCDAGVGKELSSSD